MQTVLIHRFASFTIKACLFKLYNGLFCFCLEKKRTAIFILVNLFFCFSYLFSSQEIDLGQYEKKIFSQNGEDGVVEKVFELIGSTSQYYVEFGALDGYVWSNTRLMRENYDWEGLLLDCNYEYLFTGYSKILKKKFTNFAKLLRYGTI